MRRPYARQAALGLRQMTRHPDSPGGKHKEGRSVSPVASHCGAGAGHTYRMRPASSAEVRVTATAGRTSASAGTSNKRSALSSLFKSKQAPSGDHRALCCGAERKALQPLHHKDTRARRKEPLKSWKPQEHWHSGSKHQLLGKDCSIPHAGSAPLCIREKRCTHAI